MKKAFLLTCIVLTTLSSAVGQLAFGPEAGINVSTISMKYGTGGSGGKLTSETGFKGGGLLDLRMGSRSNFYFQPGVFFSQGGAIFPGYYGNQKVVVNYVQIPANLVLKVWSDNDQFFVGAGPYFSTVGGGKSSGKGYMGKIRIGTYDEYDDIEGDDFGFGLQMGYQFGFGLFLRGQYQLGIINVVPNYNPTWGPSYQFTGENRVFSVTVGWLFHSRRDRDRGYPSFRKTGRYHY